MLYGLLIEHRKYLCFEWLGQLYHYTGYPNGLSSAPRNFTKIAKVLFSELRKEGHLNTSYIDDCLLLGKSVVECKQNIQDTVKMYENTGFVVHPEKSVLMPKQKIKYLGFLLDSKTMTVKLTSEKALKIRHKTTILNLAKIVGLMVASLPGVQYGKLFYRQCDIFKSLVLKQKYGNFDATIVINEACLQDLKWWNENIEHENRKIMTEKPTIFLESDASRTAWGGVKLLENGNKQSTGGHWAESEVDEHINVLELFAAWFTIQCFCKGLINSY